MRWLYTGLLYLFTPWIVARLLWRGWQNPAYRQGWAERFGFPTLAVRPFGKLRTSRVVWIHAVSLGETRAVEALARRLRARYPHQPLLFTAMTPTGLRQAQQFFPPSAHVGHAYLPYDYPGAVQRFLDRAQPQLGIIVETELWPNLLHACEQRGIPVILANARLSERSARGYRWVLPWIRPRLRGLHAIAAQTQADADRLIALGARTTCVQVMGSLKFDLTIPADLPARAAALRGQWQRPAWIAASTHRGEDEYALDALATMPDNVLLVLAPRHPERFAEVAALCRQRGLRVAQRSAGETVDAATRVYLADTLGELLLLYAAVDVAFVGGSLLPIGGHNPLEPAAMGIPCVVGTHTFNFAAITQQLIACGACQAIAQPAELGAAVWAWLGDAESRCQAGQRGLAWVNANRGATERLLALITPLLAKK